MATIEGQMASDPLRSRYRSVRKGAARAPEPPDVPSQHVQSAPKQDLPSRSMSRYRRARPGAASEQPDVPALPAKLLLPAVTRRETGSRSTRSRDAEYNAVPSASTERIESRNQKTVDRAVVSPNYPITVPFGEVQQNRSPKEDTRRDQRRPTDQDKRPELTKYRSREQENQHTQARRPGSDHAEKKRFFGMFSRSSADTEPKTTRAASRPQRQIDPSLDAPISAVNAGERRVLVRSKQSSIYLPVQPDTTPVDLIYSAANCLSQTIYPKDSVLVETVSELGLERPLRKYEHIRDMLNSWENDTENSVNLVDSSSVDHGLGLEVRDAPLSAPSEQKFYLYHSQKPRKWDKRWVAIRADGQVVVSKKEFPKEKEVQKICHLADFDIYSPTRRQISKVIKPPKKRCYAVKSQHKASIFLSTENYVHFFSTNDDNLVAAFHEAVQGWRSWYLVNRMGEGQKREKVAPPMRSNSIRANPRRPGSSDGPQSRHQGKESIESVPYQLGSFKPLISAEEMADVKAPSPPRTGAGAGRTRMTSQELHRRNMSLREKSAPPVSFPKQLLSDDEPLQNIFHATSPAAPDPPPFTTAGPLDHGHHHDYGQYEQDDRGIENTELPNGRLGRSSSRRSARNGTPERSLSQSRSKPKPLLDFSNPEYKEPPQHSKKGKGRGFVPDHIPPGGALVDSATSPQGPIAIPPTHSWRRPTTSSGGGEVQRSRTMKESSRRRGSISHDAPSPLPADESNAFTGQGLLAGTTGRSATVRRRGVATGDRDAKGRPMLDLTEQNRFVPGSLLASMESSTPSPGPIDREKRVEREVRVGEGV